jgi:hypothetical protein
MTVHAPGCCVDCQFPPDKECVSHRVLYNTFKRIAKALGLSDEEKLDIFHDTAMQVYRLADEMAFEPHFSSPPKL